MIHIKTRKIIGGGLLNAELTINDVTHDLGLLDPKEALDIAQELVNVNLTLLDFVKSVTPPEL